MPAPSGQPLFDAACDFSNRLVAIIAGSSLWLRSRSTWPKINDGRWIRCAFVGGALVLGEGVLAYSMDGAAGGSAVPLRIESLAHGRGSLFLVHQSW